MERGRKERMALCGTARDHAGGSSRGWREKRKMKKKSGQVTSGIVIRGNGEHANSSVAAASDDTVVTRHAHTAHFVRMCPDDHSGRSAA